MYSLSTYQSQPFQKVQIIRSQQTKKPQIICPNFLFPFILCWTKAEYKMIRWSLFKDTAQKALPPSTESYDHFFLSVFALGGGACKDIHYNLSERKKPLVPELLHMHSIRTIWRHIPPSVLAWHRSDLWHSAETAELDSILFLTPSKMPCFLGPQLCNKDKWKHLSPYWV